MTKLISIFPDKKMINVGIQMTDYCNFSCKYCVTGKKFTGEGIGESSINILVKLLSKLQKIYDKVGVNISGGEPTINPFFFGLLNLVLDLNIFVKINTNGFILSNKLEEISTLSKNLKFNITFHFEEYLDKLDLFIKSLSVLKANNIDFIINFLLPDNNISLEEFLIVKEKILNSSSLKNHNFYFNLIKDTNGKISETYSKTMLDFFDEFSHFDTDKKDLNIIFEDNKEEKISSRELLFKGLNYFSGFDCNYVNQKYVNLYIDPDLSCYFGCCYTLNRLRYSIEEVLNIFETNKNISIKCGDHSCLCETDFYTPKLFTYKNSKIYKTIFSLVESIKPDNFSLFNVVISKNNSVQIIFRYEGNYIFVIIEKIVNEKLNYFYSDGNVGYHFFIKDDKNKFIQDKVVTNNLIIFTKKLVNYNKIFLKILLDNK